MLKPMAHMAHAYPGVNNRLEEFVWLQATMNTPAKANMWRYKGSKDDAGTLYDAAKMKQYIHGKGTATKTKEKPEKLAADMVESSKVALLKLKTLLGARKYMRTKKISDIFKIQMEEIGNMLDSIETELTNNPRQGRKTYAPWIRQDLQRHWIDYMNERYITKHGVMVDQNLNPSHQLGHGPGLQKLGLQKLGLQKLGLQKLGLQKLGYNPGLQGQVPGKVLGQVPGQVPQAPRRTLQPY
ncbi:hypothetical protein GRF29_28g548960 [Pseudopithomyces chartarum]|uniref:Uncharacterized protein n=1 Tax=Pseudopithomyces chartarum TaxID=1892770 RepID=A0AAN6RKJ2_9PLEO|nr:hypothetical protein GRF29_28g548960 [Pseudopithomyces chartarum]